MYCIDCKYDLRGQTERNCPNCGRGFDPDDSDTFLEDRRISSVPRPSWVRTAMIIAWTAVPVLAFVCLPRLSSEPSPMYWLESHKNLQAVLAEWMRSGMHPSDPAATYADRVPPSVSRLTQLDVFRSRSRFVASASKEGFPFGFLLFVYSAVMIAATTGRARRVFILLTIAGFLIAAMCGRTGAEKIAERMYPGDTSYLNDFVYLDWSWERRDPHDSKLVVAYEREPLNGVLRIVAFSSGLIGNVPEADFASLEFAPPYEPRAATEAREGPD